MKHKRIRSLMQKYVWTWENTSTVKTSQLITFQHFPAYVKQYPMSKGHNLHLNAQGILYLHCEHEYDSGFKVSYWLYIQNGEQYPCCKHTLTVDFF